MKAIMTAIAVTTVLSFSAFAAQNERGSSQDQEACTPDVYRLCNDEVPDEDRIVACLKKKQKQLSPACAKVFAEERDSQKSRRN